MALSFIDSYFQQIPEGKIPVIGISGASGSGKTFLAESIAKAITDVTIVHEDNYYHELAGIKLSDSGNKNYDHPDSFDHTLLYEHIIALSKNESISQPVYNYQTHSRTKDYRVMNPGRLLIVEGILIYCDDKISQAIDIKIYMDTAPDICLLRRIQRDSKVRGRSMNQVIDQYLDTVRPMWLEFILPTKKQCPVVIQSQDEINSLISKLMEYQS